MRPHYGLGEWKSEELGNHRVVVKVNDRVPAVRVHIPWRRRDTDPQTKAILVVDAATGEQIPNVVRIAVTREYGDLVFEPMSGPGTYYLYHMPFTSAPNDYRWSSTYLAPTDTADAAWLAVNTLQQEDISGGVWKSLPEAEVVEIQAVSNFHRFDPMEVIATEAELAGLMNTHKGKGYLVFPEDRQYPIRMRDDLPQRWIDAGPTTQFTGEAYRNEFYAFQLGIYAAEQAVENVQVSFKDMTNGGATIPAGAFRCFNLGGRDFVGHRFTKIVSVPKGEVQAMWCGVQVPADAKPGRYQGEITIGARNVPSRTVVMSLDVAQHMLKDCGDSELWKMSRLRWLDSTIGIDEDVVSPYTPVEVDGPIIRCLDREVQLGMLGLPESIRSNGIEVLASPVRFNVVIAGKACTFTNGQLDVLRKAPGAVYLETTSRSPQVEATTRLKVECDGFLSYRVTLKAQENMSLDDIALVLPYDCDQATYMTGLGCEGGYRPKQWRWKQGERGMAAVWIGEAKAGLYVALKDEPDGWDLESARAAEHSSSWGKADVVMDSIGAVVQLAAHTGPIDLTAGQEIHVRFALAPTPFHPLSRDHWSQRYYQFYADIVQPEEAQKRNANVVTIHQGNELNPYINYPFLTEDKMRAYIDKAHSLGMRAKIYYTVRELSNFCAEIWALRSLGDEVFSDGAHNGDSWLLEHLVDRYARAWHQPYANGEVDAAIGNTGLSRWHNYYLEGVAWLVKSIGIDGLYLDGIAYGREGMKRYRKALNTNRPGGLLDLHEGDNYKCLDTRQSCAISRFEVMPYIDSLWFGEVFCYDEGPDYWLVEVSGIPFGLQGDMLQPPTNPWRGMLFGMSSRYWCGDDPQHLWQFWKDFGIQDAEMIGWWDSNCPVRTGHKSVLATVYKKQDATLIAIGSWAKEATSAWDNWPNMIKLDVDWQTLGLDPTKVTLHAPAIQGMQEKRTFAITEEIPVDFGKGWLLVAREDCGFCPSL